MGSHGESDAVVGRGRAACWPDTWVTDSARAPRGPAALRPVHVHVQAPRPALALGSGSSGTAMHPSTRRPSLRAPCESVTFSLAGRDASRPVPGQDHVENLIHGCGSRNGEQEKKEGRLVRGPLRLPDVAAGHLPPLGCLLPAGCGDGAPLVNYRSYIHTALMLLFVGNLDDRSRYYIRWTRLVTISIMSET
jgi:hypothetical protein